MKIKSLTQRIQEGFNPSQIDEAKDWGEIATGISNENDLVKALKALGKTPDLIKKIVNNLKDDFKGDSKAGSKDWGELATGISSENDLVKFIGTISKTSTKIKKKVLDTIKSLGVKGVAMEGLYEQLAEEVFEQLNEAKSDLKNFNAKTVKAVKDKFDHSELMKDSSKAVKYAMSIDAKLDKGQAEDLVGGILMESKKEDEDEDEKKVDEAKKAQKAKKNENEDEDDEDEDGKKVDEAKKNENEDEDDEDGEFSEDDVNEAVDIFAEFADMSDEDKVKLKESAIKKAGKKIGTKAKKGKSKAKKFVKSVWDDDHIG